MKRTYQASKIRRARTHGFLVRMKIARRPCRHQRPARQGPQAPGRLRRRVAPPHASAPRRGRGRWRVSSRRPISSVFSVRAAAPPRRISPSTTSPAVRRRRRRRSPAATGRPTYPQTREKAVNGLWMTHCRSDAPVRLARRRGAEAARTPRGDSLLAQAADLRGRRAGMRRHSPAGLWVVRLRAPFDRTPFRERGLRRPCACCARTELDALFRAASRPRRHDGELRPRLGLVPRRLLIGAVRAYRLLLSPWLGSACRFEPTCSVYALGASQRHGALAGSALTLGRIGRCHPWCAGGLDPVPAEPPRLFRALLGAAAGARRLLALPARPTPPPHDRHPPHHALGGVLRLAVPDLGRLEQAQRPAFVLRPAAGAGSPRPATASGVERRLADAVGRGRAGGHGHAAASPPARGRRPGRRAGASRRGPRSPPTSSRPRSSSNGGTLVQLDLLKHPDHVEHAWYEPLLELFGKKAEADAQAGGAARPVAGPALRRRRPAWCPPAGGAGPAEPPHADARAAGRAHPRAWPGRAAGEVRERRRSAASS